MRTLGWTGSNVVANDAMLTLGDEEIDSGMVGTTLPGPVVVDRFSQILLEGGLSGITGNLSCSVGGDAFCIDPNKITGSVTGCNFCQKP